MSIQCVSFPESDYINRFFAFFSRDPTIDIYYDVIQHILDMYVYDMEAATALRLILPREVIYKDIQININVISADSEIAKECNFFIDYDPLQIYSSALKHNPIFYEVKEENNRNYVIFHPIVLTYPSASNLCSETVLGQDIAREIFYPANHIIFCTR